MEVAGPEESAGAEARGPTDVVATGLAAGVDLCGLRPDRLPLREEAAAMYSLGVTLANCSRRAEALQFCLDWLYEWLGVERAAVVARARGSLHVEAKTRALGPSAPQLHWPVVHQAFAARAGADNPPGAGPAPLAPNGPERAFAAAVSGVKPARVVYAEWSTSGSDDKEGYPALIRAAAQALGSALPRLGRATAAPGGGSGPGPADKPGPSAMVGGEAMKPVLDFMRRAAAVEATVLITGETGTGKELVARRIHRMSTRAAGPFVVRNCAAIPESLFESELFGHERGAFTGADARHKGLFEQADRGTLFLDEVAETPVRLQSKLLRVLEELTLQRVGGHEAVRVNVRLIAATNRNLAEAVACKEFREDLYYRLQVLVVHLPPLRERPGDVERLAAHFLALAARGAEGAPAELSPEAVRKLVAHRWPGNVRELRNTLERAVILSGGQRVGPEHIVLAESPGGPSPIRSSMMLRLDDLERQHILKVLAQVGGNKARAASILGIDRVTLHRKLQRFREEAGG
jgi:two-component system response regulator HydG